MIGPVRNDRFFFKRKALVFLALCALVYGENPSLDYEFEQLTSNDGLSQNTVYCIAQDSLGFLWFGTEDGLNRYDGYNFTIFRPDWNDPYSIRSNSIMDLYTARDGTLWIGTDDGAGLIAFDPVTERFTHYTHDPGDSSSISDDVIYCLAEDSGGDLWIGGLGGLDHFYLKQHRSEPSPALSRMNPNEKSILTFIVDQDETIWAGTDKGLVHVFPGTDSLVVFSHRDQDPNSLSHNTIYAFAWDSQHNLWIGTKTGLDKLDLDSGVFQHYPNLFTHVIPGVRHSVYALYFTSDSLLWVGTSVGLYVVNTLSDHIQKIHSDVKDMGEAVGHTIYSIFQDRSGVLWFGTGSHGIHNYDPKRRKFKLETRRNQTENGLIDNSVFAIMEDRLGKIWIGTEVGLDIWDIERGTHQWIVHDPNNPNSIQHNSIGALYQDRQGIIWIGSERSLDQYDPKTGTIHHILSNRENEKTFGNHDISAFAEDSSGQLWVGTFGGGLSQYLSDTGTFTRYVHNDSDENSIGSDYVMALYTDSHGNIWIGTDGAGISVLCPETNLFTHYRHDRDKPESLGSNTVYSFYEDPNGYLWIGTHGGGLNRLDPKSGLISRYTTAEGLPNNVVYGILPDDSTRLWLSTNNGLVRFDYKTGEITSFDRYDGLQSNEFNQGAFCRRKNGQLLFGGIEGINVFHPDDIQLNTKIPPVVFTGFSISGQKVRPGLNARLPKSPNFQKTIHLNYDENDFTIAYAALNYSIPEQNQYAYRLVGYDQDWIMAGNRREARYMNIDPGKYTFKVIAANSDGVWNHTGRSLDIYIESPFWGRWWFRLAVLGLALAGIGYGFRRQLIKASRQRQYLEKRIKKRTRELNQKNEELTQAYDQLQQSNEQLEKSNENKILLIDTITHDIKNPLSVISGLADLLKQENPDNDMVNSIVRSSESLTHILNDAVTIAQISLGEPLPKETIDLTKVLRTVCDDFKHALRLAGMTLEWDVEPNLVAKVNIIIRAIFTNYISNAIKYAREGGRIKVLGRKTREGGIYIAVIDFGTTLSSDVRSKIFDRGFTLDRQSLKSRGLGLSIAKRIAQEHGAEVGVEPNIPKGNCFYLRIPAEPDE